MEGSGVHRCGGFCTCYTASGRAASCVLWCDSDLETDLDVHEMASEGATTWQGAMRSNRGNKVELVSDDFNECSVMGLHGWLLDTP